MGYTYFFLSNSIRYLNEHCIFTHHTHTTDTFSSLFGSEKDDNPTPHTHTLHRRPRMHMRERLRKRERERDRPTDKERERKLGFKPKVTSLRHKLHLVVFLFGLWFCDSVCEWIPTSLEYLLPSGGLKAKRQRDMRNNHKKRELWKEKNLWPVHHNLFLRKVSDNLMSHKHQRRCS